MSDTILTEKDDFSKMSPLKQTILIAAENRARKKWLSFSRQQLVAWYSHHREADSAEPEMEAIKEILELPENRKRRKDRQYKIRFRPLKSLKSAYSQYKKRAYRKCLQFSITEEEFQSIQSARCTYCDAPGPGGVDRIDSSEGYTIENTQPACWRCNMMKYTMGHNDFLSHIKKIHKHITK